MSGRTVADVKRERLEILRAILRRRKLLKNNAPKKGGK